MQLSGALFFGLPWLVSGGVEHANDLDLVKDDKPSSGCGVYSSCSSLEPGEWLAPGEWLTSPSEDYMAVLCSDQLQVLEVKSMKTVWTAPPLGTLSSGESLSAARISGGQLLLETARGQHVWSADLPETQTVMMRFVVTGTRGGGDCRVPQGVQLSELILWAKGKRLHLSDAKASCPDGIGPPYQGPGNAIDGSFKTKWWVQTEPNVTLALELHDAPEDGGLHFSFTTGDDMPSRDPVTWLLEGSRDGQTWTSLHRQDSSYATPLHRFSTTRPFDMSRGWRRLMKPVGEDQCSSSATAMSLTNLGSLRMAPPDPSERTQKKPPIFGDSSAAAIC